ncbi:MAG: SDR family oxidoreductase [Sulfurospirillaceae bacterium]|nr:SDR family oxidoreductase [Sulfurospirillaceae bacterium]MDD2827666.1 SDR family oxidoreductase [Sulfurospirillaceae bacterium]
MKNIIITGCSQGIGKAIAQHLSPYYHIIAIDIVKPKHNDYAAFYACDLSDVSLLLQTINAITQKYQALYALINNAGTFVHVPLLEQELDKWNKILALNLTAPYLLSKACAPFLIKEHGHIINIASTRASMSESGTEPYSASKGGLVSLSHALSISLSGKVSVNTISPGWINTDEDYTPTAEEHAWHPSGRVGKPKDIAEVVAFLLERKDGFITGSDFVIDGGVSKKMVYP